MPRTATVRMTLPMIWRRALLLILLALVPAPAQAIEPPADPLDQAALRALLHALTKPGPAYSHDLVVDLAAAERRPPEQIRTALRQRLDALHRLVEADGPSRDALLLLGRPELDARRTGRLLEELIAAGQSLLDGRDNYLLDTRLRWAAKRARVLPDEALSYAGRLLEQATQDTSIDDAAGAVIVVSGRTLQYDYTMAPLQIFFDTTDAAFIREAVRDIQRFVVPRVVRRLPHSPQVRYAVRDRDLTALIDPDFGLAIEIEDLRFTGGNTDLKPCLDAQLSLTPSGAARSTWAETVQWCTERHGSAATHRLDPFLDEAAEHIVDRVEAFLASP